MSLVDDVGILKGYCLELGDNFLVFLDVFSTLLFVISTIFFLNILFSFIFCVCFVFSSRDLFVASG